MLFFIKNGILRNCTQRKMVYLHLIFFIFASLHNCIESIKVNVQGSITLGKDVVEVFKEIIGEAPDGRRRLPSYLDKLSVLMLSYPLCKERTICENGLDNFVTEYFRALINSIEFSFGEIDTNYTYANDKGLFEADLVSIMKDVEKIIGSNDERLTEDNRYICWEDIIKKMNAVCLESAVTFGIERMEGNSSIVDDIAKKFKEKLIISLSDIELTYERILCLERDICIKRFDCTSALHGFLKRLTSLEEEKIRVFLRNFIAALGNTNFYNQLSDSTSNEFQNVLNEISFGKNISAKYVFTTVFNIVDDRIKTLQDNEESKLNDTDIRMFHIILSDLDHIYSKHERTAFDPFLTSFRKWATFGKKLGTIVSQLLEDISRVISFEPDIISSKLMNEVKTFLYLTVDPESIY